MPDKKLSALPVVESLQPSDKFLLTRQEGDLMSVAGTVSQIPLYVSAALNLGDAATKNVGTGASTVAAGNDSRFDLISTALQKNSNLSDLANPSAARTNLGLTAAATMTIGTGAGTLAAGDDARFTTALQKSNNLSDLTNVTTARTNLGVAAVDLTNVSNPTFSSKITSALGYTPANAASLSTVATTGAYADLTGKPTLSTVASTGAYNDLTGKPALGGAASLNVGTTAGTVAAGDDSRFNWPKFTDALTVRTRTAPNLKVMVANPGIDGYDEQTVEFLPISVLTPDGSTLSTRINDAVTYVDPTKDTSQGYVHWNLSGTNKIVDITMIETGKAYTISNSQTSTSTIDPGIDGVFISTTTAGQMLDLPVGASITIWRATVSLYYIQSYYDPAEATVVAPTFQLFTASGTWTKPAGAKVVKVICQNGGAGGGSGRRGATSTARNGGNGGNGGNYDEREFLASDLPSSVTVNVGAGGAGGPAVTTDDTNGSAGSAGGLSTFGSSGNTYYVYGGTAATGGSGGTATTQTQSANVFTNRQGGVGATANNAGGLGGTGIVAWAPGGGAGGGINTSNVSAAGTAGRSRTGGASNAGGTAPGGTGGNGAAPPAVTAIGPAEAGGGGAAGDAVTPGGAGGNGGGYGGGGGGGGASLNGQASGKGGDGASGAVLVITYYS